MPLTDQQVYFLLNIAVVWWLLPAFAYSFEVKSNNRYRLSWYLCILFMSWPAYLGYLIQTGRHSTESNSG